MGIQEKLEKLGPFIQDTWRTPKGKIITIGIVLLIAAGILAWLFFFSGGSANNGGLEVLGEELPQGQQIETLPATERIYEDAKPGAGGNPFQEDALDYARVAGIVINAHGRSTAIIETLTASYIAEEGKNLGDSAWLVQSISNQGITIVSGGKTRTLTMEDQGNAVEIQ